MCNTMSTLTSAFITHISSMSWYCASLTQPHTICFVGILCNTWALQLCMGLVKRRGSSLDTISKAPQFLEISLFLPLTESFPKTFSSFHAFPSLHFFCFWRCKVRLNFNIYRVIHSVIYVRVSPIRSRIRVTDQTAKRSIIGTVITIMY